MLVKNILAKKRQPKKIESLDFRTRGNLVYASM